MGNCQGVRPVAPRICAQPWLGGFECEPEQWTDALLASFVCGVAPKNGQGPRGVVTGCCANCLCYCSTYTTVEVPYILSTRFSLRPQLCDPRLPMDALRVLSVDTMDWRPAFFIALPLPFKSGDCHCSRLLCAASPPKMPRARAWLSLDVAQIVFALAQLIKCDAIVTGEVPYIRSARFG